MLQKAKKLKLQLEDAEERLEGMTDELKAAGEATAAITRKSVEREMELREEADMIRGSKEADRQATLAVLAARDSQVVALEKALSDANSTVAALQTELTVMTFLSDLVFVFVVFPKSRLLRRQSARPARPRRPLRAAKRTWWWHFLAWIRQLKSSARSCGG